MSAATKKHKDLVQRIIEFCPVPGKWAWFIQESPSFIMYALTFWWLGARSNDDNSSMIVHWRHWLHFALFQFHYVHRAVIYTWFRCVSMSKSTLLIMICGFVFCASNGYLNARYSLEMLLSDDHVEQPPISAMRMFAGLLLFFTGFYLNYSSDEILFNLRRRRNGRRSTPADDDKQQQQHQEQEQEQRYKIPRGGLFEYVTCANYFGETIEWIGYALLTGHCAAMVFAIWTPLNLLPRALSQHKWYHERFGDSYPKNRKAYIPFLL